MTEPSQPFRVVTISASFGAGGSEIAPEVARQLGWSFLDRAIPAAVAERLDVPIGEALAKDEQDDVSLFRRVLSAFAHADAVGAAPSLAAVEVPGDKTDFVAATESFLLEAADRGEVVVLGRAGAAVLRSRPGVLHVRLDGPAERRLALAAAHDGVEPESLRKRQETTDRTRSAYLRRFYQVDAADPRLYHLSIDSTALPWPACAAAIAAVVTAGR